MRYAILLGRTGGEEVFRALTSAGAPAAIGAEFKRLLAEPGNLAELQMLVSDQGVTKRKKFSPANSPAIVAPVEETPAPALIAGAAGSSSSVPSDDAETLEGGDAPAGKPRRK